MASESTPAPLSTVDRDKLMVNNPHLSDVLFLVGDEKETFYAHKYVLARGSPVFEKMFYGDLKMDTSKPIEILDLSPVGFLYMLKYIYHGFQITEYDHMNFDLIWKASNKYLVYDMDNHLTNFLEEKLEVSNCCLIYEHLINFEFRKESLMQAVKEMIQTKSREVFLAESFVKINRDTLISLLKLDKFSIAECEVLGACSRWADYWLEKQNFDVTIHNKQKMFEQIKSYIKFRALEFNHLCDFKDLKYLLDFEEIGSLFVHLLDPLTPFMLDCRTSRLVPVNYQAYISTKNISSPKNHPQIEVLLNVNQSILVNRISTRLAAKKSKLEIGEKEGIFSLSIEPSTDDKKLLEINRVFEPNTDYKFIFELDAQLDSTKTYSLNVNSKTCVDLINGEEIVFQLNSDGYHIIDLIDFTYFH